MDMNNRYMIPANANRGRLILGYFRPFDFVLFLIGVGISFILLLIYQNEMSSIWVAIGCAFPGLFCTFLVIPIPYYHNTFVVFQELFRFLTTEQTYKWEGWCYKNGTEEK